MPDPPNRHDESYNPMQLIGVIVLALLGFAVIFLSFLLAPLAILAFFYAGFAMVDRNQRAKTSDNGTPPQADPLAPGTEPPLGLAPVLGGGPAAAARPTGIPVPARAPNARPDLAPTPAAPPRTHGP